MHSKTLFDVPNGATAKVSIIDSTLRISNLPASFMMTPAMDGFDTFPEIPAWSFLVESSTGEKVVFDLGVPADINTFSPATIDRLQKFGWTITVKQHVADVLKDNGLEPADIKSIIWSHWHWDHIGDPSTFPHTTELVVGPGFKDAFLPAYPINPASPLKESYFAGRELREINFSQQQPPLKAGAFQAFDFFGDGSFYLLDTPGHAVGHLSGLARTTVNPDTFIFMGGDLCHHGGEIRPSAHLPIPPTIPVHSDLLRSRFSVCPGGSSFEELNIRRGRKPDQPFFDPAMGHDIPLAIKTINMTQVADASDDVFFIFAHDSSIMGIVDLFPLSVNQWKERGWCEKVRWSFLGDMAASVDIAK